MNEPHARFSAWLASGAHGEPARDLALHASVCPECTRAITAIDLLGRIDLGSAPIPSWDGASEEPGGLLRATRFAAAAAGVMLVAVVVGIGASQLIVGARVSGEVAFGSETPAQGLLGGAGTPVASPTPGSSIEAGSPTASPSQGPDPTLFVLPTARPTPRPTPAPTRTPRPTPTPHPTATPTPMPTPSPTDTPTPSPIPSPTGPAAIGDLVAAPGATSGTINLSWSAPSDGGSPISDYVVCRGVNQGSWPTCFSVGIVTNYTDAGLTSGQQYWYVIHAVNAVGLAPDSNEATNTAP